MLMSGTQTAHALHQLRTLYRHRLLHKEHASIMSVGGAASSTVSASAGAPGTGHRRPAASSLSAILLSLCEKPLPVF